jgi:hypothetical protein
LEEQDVMGSRIDFCLGNQARFANPSFARQQNHSPLTADLPINEQLQCGQVELAANEAGTHHCSMK